MLRRLRRFLSWPVARQWWLLQLCIYGALAKLAIPLVPFRWLGRYLGESREDGVLPSQVISASQLEQAVDIGGLTRVMASLTPWHSQCLVQVLAAKTLLSRLGIPWEVRLGVQMVSDGSMLAHAWVLVADTIIVGQKGHRVFAVVSTLYAPVSGGSGQVVTPFRPENEAPYQPGPHQTDVK